LVCARDRDLWQGPKQEVRESRTSGFCGQPQKFETITVTIGYKSGQLLHLRVTWPLPEVSIPGADQNYRGLWGRECGLVGCISKIEHAQTVVSSEMFLGLSGKETLFPARLRAQENILENNINFSATMFPRLQGSLQSSYLIQKIFCPCTGFSETF